MSGKVVAIAITPLKHEPMQLVETVRAIRGRGLEGDRRVAKGKYVERQVTLISQEAVARSTFNHVDTRRQILTLGIELTGLIGRRFTIGGVIMKGVGYADPCPNPSRLVGRADGDFKNEFFDCAGIIAIVIKGGDIHTGDEIVKLAW